MPCHFEFRVLCPPLNRITLGRYKSDNNNKMNQLTRAVARQICTMGEAKICAPPEIFIDKIALKLKQCGFFDTF